MSDKIINSIKFDKIFSVKQILSFKNGMVYYVFFCLEFKSEFKNCFSCLRDKWIKFYWKIFFVYA